MNKIIERLLTAVEWSYIYDFAQRIALGLVQPIQHYANQHKGSYYNTAAPIVVFSLIEAVCARYRPVSRCAHWLHQCYYQKLPINLKSYAVRFDSHTKLLAQQTINQTLGRFIRGVLCRLVAQCGLWGETPITTWFTFCSEELSLIYQDFHVLPTSCESYAAGFMLAICAEPDFLEGNVGNSGLVLRHMADTEITIPSTNFVEYMQRGATSVRPA